MIAAALTLPVSAAESFLVPMHTPTPVFPAELIKTRYAGKVRAQLCTVGLGNIRCGYLNHEVKSARQDSPKEPLSKINVFSYTGQALFGSHAAHQRTEPERKALLEQLDAAIPTVVSNCRSNPDHRYVDYLPAPVRVLMVGLAEGSE
ncbi:TonB domain-containing protein [Pseudomonas syringae pv. actinidiae ICMP 19071]|nr:hypothetical protein [Pseudomonas syringae]EPM53111.1 TonB domain-containing protein [Pseudomonas syringae pv. actinidiae ICMP 19073]EPM61471.1 TonB domain-containing protein [Pseudomonas syringae pv. actinidiae ICMP 19071]EPM79234.1 TonB domain-containing protein [Pseudomonas syringae pv. actinidiae ICMP 19072]OSN67020.1 hypothetical protein BV349_01986 [Pseudomonas syringae pv. actinidiae]OSN77739.1 hypothetical protein BV351_01900 [Pseudomonas syringae pv. actinidiae]